jgi:hypothetical protein
MFSEHIMSPVTIVRQPILSPDTKYAQIGGIIDNIVAKKCEPLYQKMQVSLANIQNQRPPIAEQFWENTNPIISIITKPFLSKE